MRVMSVRKVVKVLICQEGAWSQSFGSVHGDKRGCVLDAESERKRGKAKGNKEEKQNEYKWHSAGARESRPAWSSAETRALCALVVYLGLLELLGLLQWVLLGF